MWLQLQSRLRAVPWTCWWPAVYNKSNKPFASTLVQNRISRGPRRRCCNSAAFYSVNCPSPDAWRPHKNRGWCHEIAAESAEQRIGLTVRKYIVGKVILLRLQECKKKEKRENAAGRGDALRNYSPKTQHNTKRSSLLFDAQSSHPVALTFLFFFLPFSWRCATQNA